MNVDIFYRFAIYMINTEMHDTTYHNDLIHDQVYLSIVYAYISTDTKLTLNNSLIGIKIWLYG